MGLGARSRLCLLGLEMSARIGSQPGGGYSVT
jgi:hypothetical protein